MKKANIYGSPFSYSSLLFHPFLLAVPILTAGVTALFICFPTGYSLDLVPFR